MKNRNVFFWSVVVALGGVLFGFDTAVISGAEESIQKLWSLRAYAHGLTMSITLIFTVIGAIFGSLPSDALGRRGTLVWIAVLYLVSAVGAALSPSWLPFMVFRFLGGLGVGASSVTAPLYISEVSPPASRGRMVGMFQFNVVFGILLAYLSNFLLCGIGPDAWRWMLGVQAVPAIAFFLLLFRIPESPRWLLRHGRPDEARAVFARIDPATADENIRNILVADAFVFGSLAARQAGTRQTLYRLLERARFKVFDVNMRPPHYTREVVKYLLSKANLVKMNPYELAEIMTWFGDDTEPSAAMPWLAQRFDLHAVCVACGADGALLWANKQLYRASGVAVQVQDTIGSGDAFLAALLKGWLTGRPPQQALHFACAAGALVATRQGATPTFSEADVWALM